MEAKNIVFGVLGAGILIGGAFAVRGMVRRAKDKKAYSPDKPEKGGGSSSSIVNPQETTSDSLKEGKGTAFPLKVGSWGRKVVKLQYALNQTFGHKLVIDGKFGNATKDALNDKSPIEWCRYDIFGGCDVTETDYNEIIKGVDFTNVQTTIDQWDSADAKPQERGHKKYKHNKRRQAHIKYNRPRCREVSRGNNLSTGICRKRIRCEDRNGKLISDQYMTCDVPFNQYDYNLASGVKTSPSKPKSPTPNVPMKKQKEHGREYKGETWNCWIDSKVGSGSNCAKIIKCRSNKDRTKTIHKRCHEKFMQHGYILADGDNGLWTEGAEASQPYALAGGTYPSESQGEWASMNSGWANEMLTEVVHDDFWDSVDGGLASRYAFWGMDNPQGNYANAKGSSGIKRGNECPCPTSGSNTECYHGYCVMQGSCQVGGVKKEKSKPKRY